MLTDIRNHWKTYMELGESVVKGKLSKEEFKKQINVFSSFISETNQDYHYNATYLSHYVIEFLHFLECFNKKYPLVERLFEVSSYYSDVCLIIDRYWQQESTWDEERKKISSTNKVYPSYEKTLVCDDNLLIECSILCKINRFIYHSKIGINEKEIQQELQNLKEFLNDKTALKNRKEEKEGKEFKI